VGEGQRCWVFLYPQTITGIRHHWRHPFFQDQDAHPTVDREWITAFAARWKYSFDEFMEGAHEYIEDNHQLDDKWNQLYVPKEDWNEFWAHFYKLTGLSIGDKDKEFVYCCPT
jgi:hypothetical protein